jgi:DNA-binding IclR family transcriptional regulator
MTTLSSAADILRCFSDEQPDLTVTQVARLLGMPKSNASRLLRSMAACGMLETVGASKRYRPGIAVHEAGRQYRLTSPFAGKVDEAAHTALARLAGAVERVAAVERDRAHVLVVSEWGLGGPLLRPAAPRLAASQAAAGLALLSRLSDQGVREVMTSPIPGFAPLDGGVLEEAARAAGLARRRGFATFSETGGRLEIAVAFGDPVARKEAALTATAPDGAGVEAVLAIATVLHEAARAIAAAARDPGFALLRVDAL